MRTIAVAAALVVAVGLFVVNARLEKAVVGSIDQAILSVGPNELFAYDSVDVQSARGTVRMNGIVYRRPDMAAVFEAASFAISAKPWELVMLAQSGGASALSEISGALEDFRIRFQVDGGAVQLQHGRARVSGNFTESAVSQGVEALVATIEAIDVSFREISVTPGDRMLQRIQTGMQHTPWLADEANWSAASVELQARRDGSVVVVDRFAVDAALAQVHAQGRGTLNTLGEPVPEEGRIVVERMHPELRRQVRETGSFYFGIQIPEEGTFTVNYARDEQGVPGFNVE